MKVIQNIIIIAIVIAILSFAGCGKDTIQTTKVSLTLLLPDNAKDLNILRILHGLNLKCIYGKNILIQRFRQYYFTEGLTTAFL